MLVKLMAIAVILGVAIKTINYGRWSGQQGNRRGAVGLYVLAGLLVGCLALL
jgi:hypothetical protein